MSEVSELSSEDEEEELIVTVSTRSSRLKTVADVRAEDPDTRTSQRADTTTTTASAASKAQAQARPPCEAVRPLQTNRPETCPRSVPPMHSLCPRS